MLDCLEDVDAANDMMQRPEQGRNGDAGPSRPASFLPSSSIGNKLLIFVAALVVTLGVWLIAIAERHGSDSLEVAIGRELSREARHTAERLSSVLRTEQETLASFARQDLMREIRVGDIDKRISQALVTLRDGSALRLDYWVVDSTGRVVASSDPARIDGLGSRRIEADTPAGPATVRLRDERLYLSSVVPDPDAPGRTLGTLFGVFDWQRVTGSTEEVRRELGELGLDSDLFVLRPDGTVLGGAWHDAPSRALLAMLRGVAADEGAAPPPEWIVRPLATRTRPAGAALGLPARGRRASGTRARPGSRPVETPARDDGARASRRARGRGVRCAPGRPPAGGIDRGHPRPRTG